ncbi:cell division cycle-associated protein 2 isoform X2 [Myripristis murdjan]|uniref:cell division cycle-associated protein 2 isoform X2 n=1 Tax=Myripristis murdjan TaxID=586833 RepID=UPI001175EA19|nr:cell division cycle-associated protein 2 isoform X2 [Myripristis murdjan]
MQNMTSPELNAAGIEGDEEVRKLSSSEEEHVSLLGDTSAPLNFSQLSPSRFGISTQSFIPSSANHKDKSRLAQLKARRRSNIGVRGSPETNSLIRYMAQQRIKTPPTYQTPEPFKNSPFLPRVASTLRQKMASFQSLMDVEESEVCGPAPRQDSETGGCVETRDYLSAEDDRSLDGGKENCPPMMTPTPNKRRRIGPVRDCVGEIRGASTPILRHTSLKEQEADKEPAIQDGLQGPIPSSESVADVQAVLFFPPVHLDPPCDLQACSPTDQQTRQEGFFELQSPSSQSKDPAAVVPAQTASAFPMPSLPSLQEMQPTGVVSSSGASTLKKKKQVRFGGPLSPEFFDKNLPPSTPLQKGSTPARAPTPGEGFQLRSVLKTPQMSEPCPSLAQLNLSSPSVFGASPTLAMPRSGRKQAVGEDAVEKCGKIAFPSVEELDSMLTNSTECTWEAQPLDLNAAFQEESLLEMLTAPALEAKPSGPSKIDILDVPEPLPGMEMQPEPHIEALIPAPPRLSNRKREAGPEPKSRIEVPVRSSSRKRKPEDSKPVKRSTRSAAKSASGKMKTSSVKRRWGNKEVDRSLYGSREYASKNPNLSPITETLSSTSRSPTPQEPRSRRCTASRDTPIKSNLLLVQDQESPLSLSYVGSLINSDSITGVAMGAAVLHYGSPATNNTQQIVDITTTSPQGTPSETPAEPAAPSKDGAVGKGKKHLGPKLSCGNGREVRGRKWKGRKVSVSADDCLSEECQDQQETCGKGDGCCQEEAATNQKASEETSYKYIATENVEVNTGEVCLQTPVDKPCTHTDYSAECHTSVEAPTLAHTFSEVGISETVSFSDKNLANQRKSAPRNAEADMGARCRSRGRRSSGYHSVPPESKEQTSQAAEHHTDHKAEEKKLRDQAASQLEANHQSSSALAPWQAEFNLEDVFKPVATRGQRSVRRSLRNQSNVDHSSGDSGLAWLPRTSPDSSTQARRRTRGQKLSGTAPVQSP